MPIGLATSVSPQKSSFFGSMAGFFRTFSLSCYLFSILYSGKVIYHNLSIENKAIFKTALQPKNDISKMPLHSDDYIARRRERVASLLAKGVHPRSISNALETSLKIVNADIRFLNKENEKKMFEMAKQTIPTLYMNCLTNMNELIEQCWNMYVRSNTRQVRNAEGDIVEEPVDPRDWITPDTRMKAVKIAGELTDIKFKMIQDGPAVFELKKMEKKLEDLRNGIELSV